MSDRVVGFKNRAGEEVFFPSFMLDAAGNPFGLLGPDGERLRVPRIAGFTGAMKHWSVAAFPSGSSNITIQNQIPIPYAATGFRLFYNNGTLATATITTAKAAVTSTDGHTGANLTYTSATFDGAATAVLPPATGTAPNETRYPVVSDHIALSANAGQYLIVRTYFAGANACADNPAVGELLAFNAATGLNYKTCFATGVIADSAVCGTVDTGRLIVPQGIIWTFANEGRTAAFFGGSHSRGQGSTGNATGMGYRTAANLSNSSRTVMPFVAGISGQNSAGALADIMQVLPKVRPDVAVLFPGSGNNTDLTAAGFEVMKGQLATAIEYCTRHNVIPVVVTLMPGNLAAGPEALRVAQNAYVMSKRAYYHVSDLASPIQSTSNAALIAAAYDSGDGIHLNDAGHIIAGGVLSSTIGSFI